MKQKWTLTQPVFIAVCGMLTACGGSGSGSEGNGAGTSNTVTITATVVQNTVCNTQVPATTAELVVYDNDWVIKSRHKPDASGAIKATIPKTEYANISMITTNGLGSARIIDANTFTQHPVGDIGVFTIPGASQQGCECQTTNITLTAGQMFRRAPQLSGHNSYKPFDSYNTYTNTYELYGVEICRVPGTEWPTLYASTNYFELFKAAGYISEYDPSASALVLDLNQTPSSYSANFDYAATSHNVMHNFGDNYFYYGEVGTSNSIELFDNMPGLSAITLRAYDTRTDYYDGVEVRVGRSQRHSIAPPYNTAIDVNLPDTQSNEQLLQSMLTWFNSGSNSYDLSSISEFETFSITLAAYLTDGSNYNETFYGPKKGVIPQNTLPADYGVEALLDEDNISLYINMMRYGEQQSYQQYLQSNIAASRMTRTQRLLGNRSQYNSIFVDIFQ